MKNLSGLFTLFVLLSLACFASPARAQADLKSSWIEYKPINKIAAKKLFNDHRLRASHIHAETLTDADWVRSKAVHRNKQTATKGNVVSRGYPTWTISKPIHR